MHDGIPKPKANPKRRENIAILIVQVIPIIIGINEETMPNDIHNESRLCRLTSRFDKAAPTKAVHVTPPKWMIHIMVVSYEVMLMESTICAKTSNATMYQVKALSTMNRIVRNRARVTPKSTKEPRFDICNHHTPFLIV